jgi:hypothetical protein
MLPGQASDQSQLLLVDFVLTQNGRCNEKTLTGTEKRSKQPKVRNARKEHECEQKEQPKQKHRQGQTQRIRKKQSSEYELQEYWH